MFTQIGCAACAGRQAGAPPAVGARRRTCVPPLARVHAQTPAHSLLAQRVLKHSATRRSTPVYMSPELIN